MVVTINQLEDFQNEHFPGYVETPRNDVCKFDPALVLHEQVYSKYLWQSGDSILRGKCIFDAGARLPRHCQPVT